MPPRHMQTSLGCLCLRVQTGIPSRPERKTSPLYYPNPSPGCGQPAPPMQCWRLRNTVLKQEGNDYFAPGNQSPNSALLATNIASIGGAGVRYGEDGWGRFSLGTDSGAMVLHCYHRVCVVWIMDDVAFVGTTTSCRHVYERGFVGAVGAVVGAV